MGEEAEKSLSSEESSSPLPVSTEPGPDDGSEGTAFQIYAEEKGAAEKLTAEASTTAEPQGNKFAEAVENAEKKTVVEDRELNPAIDKEPTAVPFVEESYYVKDLKVSEKKALKHFKSKIADAINNDTFLRPSSNTANAGAIREVSVEKAGEVEKKEHRTAEGEERATQEEVKAPDEEQTQELLESYVTVSMEDEEQKEASTKVEEEAEKEAKSPGCAPSVTKDHTSIIKTPSSTAAEEQKTTMSSTAEVELVPSQDRDIHIEPEDESTSCEDLSLWGVPLLHSEGDERTDVVLLKFLRARDFKVNDAMTMLKDTIWWRKDFSADEITTEEMTTEFDSVAYMHGVDKEGHPVCYNHYGLFQDKELFQKTFEDESPLKKFLRWRVQVLEKGIQRLNFKPGGVHSMVQVTDLKGSPGFVKRRNITKKALTILQDNYPELVAKQIFVNVPWYFGAQYVLHGRSLTARSKSKVILVRPEKVTETLFKYIPVENLPVRYGGFSRANDTDFEGVEAQVQEVVMKTGGKQIIELPEQEVGSTAVWDVAVVGWEVVYGEEFVPSEEDKYTVIIQKPKKMAAAEEPLRNSFMAAVNAGKGKVVITIENSSKKKKLLAYRHTIKLT